MGITELLVAEINRTISPLAMLRGLLEHAPWLMAKNVGGLTFFPTREAYDAAVRDHKPGTFEELVPVAHIDETLAGTEDVLFVRFESGQGLSRAIDTDLERVRAMARGIGVERAIVDGRYRNLRQHESFYVPYFGKLGEGHQVICLPTERGSMVAAFTTEDAVDRFVDSGSAEDQARVQFVGVDGDTLFGKAAPAMAQGVIVNVAGPRTYGFTLETCRDIANA